MTLSYMEIEVHNKVNANTNLWILPSHHIYLTFNKLACIFVDGTKRFPFYTATKGGGWGVEMKGQRLVLFKRQGW